MNTQDRRWIERPLRERGLQDPGRVDGSIDAYEPKPKKSEVTFEDIYEEALTLGYSPRSAEIKARTLLGAIKAGANDDPEALYEAWTGSSEYRSLYGGVNSQRLAAGGISMTDVQIEESRRTYRKLMRDTGMPPEFYDSDSDADRFLANDVSPTELGERIKNARKVVGNNVPQETKDAFKQYYGLDEGDLAAYLLDPKKALPVLEKRATVAGIGGSALRQGLEASRSYATDLYEQGVTESEAAGAFGSVAMTAPDMAAIAGASNTGVTMEEQTDAALGLDATAVTKVKRLASQERARFSGGTSYAQGMLNDSVSGSY